MYFNQGMVRQAMGKFLLLIIEQSAHRGKLNVNQSFMVVLVSVRAPSGNFKKENKSNFNM